MKAAVLTGIGQLEVMEAQRPSKPGTGEVLLEVLTVGVCGSDVHYWRTGRIGSQVVEYPWRVGHEFSARVAAVGERVERVRVGDLVAVDPAMACLSCDQCMSGRENTCRQLRFLACPGQAQGCLCEWIVMPEHSVFAVPAGVSVDEAALLEPFSIGLYAVRQAQLSVGQAMAVLGSGPIGLSVLLAAGATARVTSYATDRVTARVGAARRAGAVWSGNPDETDVAAEILSRRPEGVDAVFECAGQQETLEQGLAVLKPGGRLLLIGIPEFEAFSLPADGMRRKEATVVNVRRQNGCVGPALDLVASGAVELGWLATHRFGLAQVAQAFELVAGRQDGVLKAMVDVGRL